MTIGKQIELYMIYGSAYFNFLCLYSFSILLLQCVGLLFLQLVPVNKK